MKHNSTLGIFFFYWRLRRISDTDFPGHFHIQSHSPLRRIYTNQAFGGKGDSKNTFQPGIFMHQEIVFFSSIFWGGLNEYWQKWLVPPIPWDIWSKYPSLGHPLMPWSIFMSYFMRHHQSDQPTLRMRNCNTMIPISGGSDRLGEGNEAVQKCFDITTQIFPTLGLIQ